MSSLQALQRHRAKKFPCKPALRKALNEEREEKRRETARRYYARQHFYLLLQETYFFMQYVFSKQQGTDIPYLSDMFRSLEMP
jgi:hypothetical protein